MSQNSLVLPTTGTLAGLTLVSGLNSAIDSLNTLNSGGSAPSTTEADQWWMDTTNGLLKQRDGGNANWIIQAIRGIANGGGVRHSGFGSNIAASTTLTASQIGQVISLTPSGAITLTMPSAATCPSGSGFLFRNIGSAAVSIAVQGTDTTSISGSIYPGETVWMSSNGLGGGSGVWVDIFHAVSAVSRSTGATASSGFLRGVGGVIDQWGTFTGTTNSGGGLGVTFPEAFPNACFIPVCCPGDSNATAMTTEVIAAQVTTSGFGVATNFASTPVRINFMAKGN